MSGDVDRLVLILLSGTRMAIDLASVTEVTELPETWQIPLAPRFFKGAMNSHGRLIPVLDLALWTGSGIGKPGGKTLILDRRLADLALWVDDVEQVMHFSCSSQLSHEEGFIAAILEIDGSKVPLISAKSLVDMLEHNMRGTSQLSSAGLKGTA